MTALLWFRRDLRLRDGLALTAALHGGRDVDLREPWTMSDDLQREVGCAIGRDYPGPVVDRREARRHAFERYEV